MLSNKSNKNIYRKTRFHDEKGNLIDFFGFLYSPLAFWGATLRFLFDYRPKKPTISFRATRKIEKILKSSYSCVEFGSGMSTIWLAKRCKFLLSRENDPFWHDKISNYLEKNSITNIQYELCDEKNFSLLSNFQDNFFDFALIDGWDRAGCVASVLPKLKVGGWLYLDNSDKDMMYSNGDLRRAEKLILDYAKIKNKTPIYFVDFSRTNFFVEQGLLLQV